MMSSTRNVKLGICRAYFDGDDLGLTQGGVEVTISTDTHKVEVDQLGKTAINEYIMGRSLTVKVPMAETSLENLVKIMPGSIMGSTGGAKATGTISVGTNPTAGTTLVVNGVTFTFRATGAAVGQYEINLGATPTATATNIAAALNACTRDEVARADYSAATTTVTANYEFAGTEGNSFTLGAGTSGVTVSGATLSGGTEPTAKWVTINHGIGADLLSTAMELRLHPSALPISDTSEDFIIPLANTAGGLNFAYKLDQERTFPVEFTGYPDPVTGVLAVFGARP
jgi:hypothetical protein